jgi:hypothetical protein
MEGERSQKNKGDSQLGVEEEREGKVRNELIPLICLRMISKLDYNTYWSSLLGFGVVVCSFMSRLGFPYIFFGLGESAIIRPRFVVMVVVSSISSCGDTLCGDLWLGILDCPSPSSNRHF